MVQNPERKQDTETTSVTAQPNVSIDHCTLAKSGNTVFLYAVITTTANFSVFNNLFILPSGYMPIDSCIANVTAFTLPTQVYIPTNYTAYIDSGGSCCAGGNGLPAGTYAFSCVYLTA